MTRRPPPQRRSNSGPLAFTLLAIGVIVFIVAAGPTFAGDAVVALASDRDSLLRQAPIRSIVADRLGPAVMLPADPNAELRDFDVGKGESVSDVARRLEGEGIVRSRLALLIAMYEKGIADRLQAGPHRVGPAMTPAEVGETLVTKPPQDQVTLRIIEGWRLTEIAKEVSKVFPQISPEAFLRAAVVGTRSDPILKGLDPATPLEGVLFPDTYFFKPTASAEDVIVRLLGTFSEKAGPAFAGATVKGLKPYEIVKLASIVEREARDWKESATIAGVYANRLALGMKLDADPTVQYAKGSWAVLLLPDLQVDSPYNTYKVAGLPPTPIASPGLAAIEAAARPQQHDFLYFVAKGDGSGDHLFAKTLEEQEANRVKVGNTSAP